METQTLAGLLLLGRLTAVFFLRKTLRAQNRLLKLRIDNDDDGEIKELRLTLHRMTLIIFFGQFVPIIIDTWAIVSPSTRPFWLGVLYAISNCLTAITAALLIWRIYQLAEKPGKNKIQMTKSERKHLKNTQKGV